MLGFSEEDKERIGVAQQGGGGKGVVRGVLGLPGRFVGGILGGKSAGSHANAAASDNQVKTPSSLIQRMSTQEQVFSLRDNVLLGFCICSHLRIYGWISYSKTQKSEKEEKQKRQQQQPKPNKIRRRQDKTHLCRLNQNFRRCLSDRQRVINGSRDYFSKIIK